MYSLSLLMRRFRLKWIFATGIAVGVLRFALFAFDTFPAVLLGVFLHGFCFTFYYVTTQIYIDERIDPAFRARGQALMTLLVAGLATLSGMQLTGRWFRACSLADGTVDWTRFWSALAATCLLVLTYFLVSFKGDAEQTRHRSLPSTPTEPH
jgi:MFS family permease